VALQKLSENEDCCAEVRSTKAGDDQQMGKCFELRLGKPVEKE